MRVGDTLWVIGCAIWLLAIVVYDLRWRRVPNPLVLVALACQSFWLLTVQFSAWEPSIWGAVTWTNALAGFALGAAFVVFWRWRLLGAGDVKFLAALGFVMGIVAMPDILMWSAIPSFIHAITQFWGKRRDVILSRARVRRGIPYGAYLAIAGLSVGLMRWNSHSCLSFFSLCST
ncbi:A24 family peptidase [Schauerella aestuarii]|uniref:A24 family peptidase n=1 Tax=Schauerella aestuarii TaxID=2511204 RepID=UPI002E2AF1D7|nr:A24 family peptidase [Achromobacter aestuarii]